MANPEKRETNRFVEDLKEHFSKFKGGVFAHKVHGTVFSSGIPDLIIVVLGHTWFIEFKIKGNKPTAKQRKKMGQLARAGGLVGLCTIDVLKKGSRWALVFDVMDEKGALHRIAEITRRRGQTWNLQFLYEFAERVERRNEDWL